MGADVECSKYKTLAEHDGCSACFAFRERERKKMRMALEELCKMMGPEGREAFVMQGPRMFSAVLRVVEDALK